MNALPASIGEAAQALRRGERSCVGLVRAALERIHAEEPRLNAFLTVTAERALAEAGERDAELRAGVDRGVLHGIPIAYKDCIDTAGVRTTVGSRHFCDRIPGSDAKVVERLTAAGAVLLGKTNMNEFAAGTSGKNVFHGDVHNPWALERSAGGSSSGMAAALASGMVLAGVGTDAGGSIRVPAACTGIVGLRPTMGLVPLAGVFPRSYSFDAAGPLGRTVEDCAALLRALRQDNQPVGIDAGIAGVRIGVVDGFSLSEVHPDVGAALSRALDRFAALGARVRSVAVPALSSVRDFGPLVDIMRFEFNRILGDAFRACPDPEQTFGPVVCADLRRGMQIGEEAYRQALELKAERCAGIRAAFAEVDALVTPVLAIPVPRLDAAPEAFDAQRRFMIPFSAAGVPALSLPCGADGTGLPIGLQLVADRQQEKLLFRIGRAFECGGEWHTRLWGHNKRGAGS